MLASLAGQLSVAVENARMYHDLDRLFRQYVSPDVATALLADPSQAALGGEEREVTVLFADLQGFTAFSERAIRPRSCRCSTTTSGSRFRSCSPKAARSRTSSATR